MLKKIKRQIKVKYNFLKRFFQFLFNPIIQFISDAEFRKSIYFARAYKKNSVDAQMVLYEAYNGSSMSDNPYAIFKELFYADAFKDWTHIWVLNDKDNPYAKEFKIFKNVIFVKRESKAYFRYLSSAKYLINNSTFAFYFTKKEEQVYINTWHGTPLKTMLKDIAGIIHEHRNILRNLTMIDYLVSSNRFTENILLYSSGIGEVYPGKLMDTGSPRIDLIRNANRADVTKKLVELYKIDIQNKKVVLYAPTWRGEDGAGSGTKDRMDVSEELSKYIEQMVNQAPDNVVVLLKVHNFMKNFFIKKKSAIQNHIILDDIETNELLSVVDCLVTDYSSIFFDYLHTQKPVVFFNYDGEEYSRKRGLYFEFKELPGACCHTPEQLNKQINLIIQQPHEYQNKYAENIKRFLEEFCASDDGLATKRVVDVVFRNKEQYLARKIVNNKKKLLIYPGGLKNNGITSSFINLLNNIDYNHFEVVVVSHGPLAQKRLNNFLKINQNAKVLYRSTAKTCFTLREYYKHRFILSGFMRNKNITVDKDSYIRDYRRICGDIMFDMAINFDGYSANWVLFLLGFPAKKIIFQHSQMNADRYRVSRGRRIHFLSLSTVFQLYKYYETIIAVSKEVAEANQRDLKHYLKGKKIKIMQNTIDYQKVLDSKKIILKPDYLQIAGKQEAVLQCRRYIENQEPETWYVKFPDSKKVNFVTTGRLSAEKDHEKLVKAFAMVASERDDICLYIIGEGPQRKRLNLLIAELHLEDKVFLCGFRDNPFPLMALCDCFLLSSNYEGQPMVLLEAFVLGLPIISTDIPGARSVLKDDLGSLVENSIAGLAQGICDFLDHRQEVKPFDYKEYNKQVLEVLYRECGLM